MDISIVGGVVLALACILFGQWLEGGHAASLVQATAAIIVIGGTIGAVIVAFPPATVLAGLKMAAAANKKLRDDTADISARLVDLATTARRDGVLALEQKIGELTDPFMQRAVRFVVDGVDARITRDALETEIHHEYEQNLQAAKIWESAGGFAPTIGILGAVLGLIHVMENLSDPSKLGPGIATAFVATVYGVGSSNLLFLPLANKLKLGVARARDRKTIIAEGVLSIQEGINPRVLEEKLKAYGHHGGSHNDKKK